MGADMEQDEDPWLAHLEKIFAGRAGGANPKDPEDLSTIMLRRLVVKFGESSDYINSLIPTLIHQFATDYIREQHTKKCWCLLDRNFLLLSLKKIKIKPSKLGKGHDPYSTPPPKRVEE